MQDDFTILDCKMKEILDSEDLDKESLGDIVVKLKESFMDLSECAELRNKKIEELLKAIKN